MITKENIWDEIKKKNYLEVLKSDFVDQVKEGRGDSPLHRLARYGVKDVLNHPSVDKVKDKNGNTPLHFLAYNGEKEVLNHPSVDKVKNHYGGRTPLHFSAYKGVKDILDHPSVDKVKDHYGKTPLHDLAYNSHLTIEDLRKKYPWYKKEIKDIREAVNEIVNTPTSIKFILEDS